MPLTDTGNSSPGQKSYPDRLETALGALLVLLAVVLAASCAGNRPTLTNERLVDATEATATAATNEQALLDAANSPDNAATATASAIAEDLNQPQPDVEVDGQRDLDLRADVPGIERLRVAVDETFVHDSNAFTQGLEFVDGVFIESTGLYDQSDLRRVDISTGEVLAQVPTPDGLFAEGLTAVDDRLIQLTWKAGRAFVWDAATLELVDEFEYDGQGWGLCFNGNELVMTDGSSNLFFRDPNTFELLRTTPVLFDGVPVTNLNEVECVNSDVYINIWMTDQIVRANQFSGLVNAVVDASDLAQPRPEGSNVLNGIAYDRQNDIFYLTGKLWPTMHRVRFLLEPGTN